MAHKRKNKNNGAELDVFQNRAARANIAIFDILAKESLQNVKQLLKKITKYEGLEEIYYASLTKRLHRLQEAGYIREAKQKETAWGQTRYELRMKARLAMFLKDYCMQEVLNRATDSQAANILLAILSIFQKDMECVERY